ncbi:cobalamin biosynthesis protein, partial [Streptomyces sp. NPDC005921]
MASLRGYFHPKTASGASSLIPSPPWRYSGDLLTVEYRTDPARVRELLPEPLELAEEDGEPVALRAESSWPLPPLPLAGEGAYTVRLTDRAVEPAANEVLLRPPSLVVGVGASKGAPVEEVLTLIEAAVRDAGLSPRSIAELATVDAKAGEPGIVEAAARLGVPLVTHSAEELAEVRVPNPSDAPLAAVGTPSVAEAAALLRGGELLVPKRKSDGRPAMATCAVVRRPARGRLAVVGLGPGARDLLTPRARAELRRASVLVGLDQYVDQIRDL